MHRGRIIESPTDSLKQKDTTKETKEKQINVRINEMMIDEAILINELKKIFNLAWIKEENSANDDASETNYKYKIHKPEAVAEATINSHSVIKNPVSDKAANALKAIDSNDYDYDDPEVWAMFTGHLDESGKLVATHSGYWINGSCGNFVVTNDTTDPDSKKLLNHLNDKFGGFVNKELAILNNELESLHKRPVQDQPQVERNLPKPK